MMSKHTEGPWIILPDNHSGQYTIASEDEPLSIAVVYPTVVSGTATANAALVAAAPDLLAACRATLAHMYDDETDAPTAAQLTEQLTRAIAKAESEE